MSYIRFDKNLQVPAIVTMTKVGCSVDVPDLNITIHGRDYLEALANAMLNVSAIYYYSHEHNLSMNLSKTYQEVEAMAFARNDGSFATYLGLTT